MVKCVVGIAGGSCSGKTTLTDLLSQRLSYCNPQVIRMDHFFKKEKPVCQAPFSGREYEDYNQPDSFETERMVAEIDRLIASDNKLLLIEGLLVLQNDDIRSRLNIKVFLDCRSDERLARRITRNLKLGYDYDEIVDYYLDSVRYRYDEFLEPSRYHADLILNGSRYGGQGQEFLITIIKDLIDR